MADKARIQGVVTSDRMEKSVVVSVERQVRHPLYGKIQRRTSTFLAHNEGNEAKIGDLVEIVEGRPMSRRKRWAVARIVQRAAGVEAVEAAADGERSRQEVRHDPDAIGPRRRRQLRGPQDPRSSTRSAGRPAGSRTSATSSRRR